VQGFLKVDGNGYFGEATTKALKEFQLEWLGSEYSTGNFLKYTRAKVNELNK
jgi:hypothetical protein